MPVAAVPAHSSVVWIRRFLLAVLITVAMPIPARAAARASEGNALTGLCFALSLLVLAQFGLIFWMYRRHQQQLTAAELGKRAVTERLFEQEARLHKRHDVIAAAAREKALTTERQRLMQDMHDGLGSALLSAMVAVEHGNLDRQSTVDILRECVNDLRLVIDSLEPVGHDLMALLATMRYRLGKRLQASGLLLEWDVQDLPMLDWLEPPDALHVLRMMQEALNNVLKHAKAGRVRIVTRHLGRYVEIRVEDDGQGFDPETIQRGRGLKSQQRRAEALGGAITIETTPGQGTRLCLMLPVRRRPRSPKPGVGPIEPL